MPHEPKRRHSRTRKGERRASIKLAMPKGIVCPNCKSITMPHQACETCGFYKGKQVVSVKSQVKK